MTWWGCLGVVWRSLGQMVLLASSLLPDDLLSVTVVWLCYALVLIPTCWGLADLLPSYWHVWGSLTYCRLVDVLGGSLTCHLTDMLGGSLSYYCLTDFCGSLTYCHAGCSLSHCRLTNMLVAC